ncbi:MAG: 4-hydroxyphenylpyruvate dioxygenase, partial [Sphingomonas sp.]
MTADRQDNPMGLNGFEFVEFTGPDPQALADLFEKMGYPHPATHNTNTVRPYSQAQITFRINMEATGQVAGFREQHGPSANAMACRVADAEKALKLA